MPTARETTLRTKTSKKIQRKRRGKQWTVTLKTYGRTDEGMNRELVGEMEKRRN